MIEVVSKRSLKETLPLIRAYQEFYKVADISDERNEQFFSQFCEDNPAGCQFLYRELGTAVGFATVYFSYASSITAKVGVLNDLYTLPEHRGKGIGRQLIEHCRAYAREQRATRLQWVTSPENHEAQKLYNSIGATKSTW